MRDIGKNIHTLRTQKNMTQDELAAALFVTRQTVSNYETGRSRPDVDMLLRIAQVLDTDANTLLYGPQPPQTEKSRRPILHLAAGAAVFLVLLVGYFVLSPLANRLYLLFFALPRMVMHSLYKPLLGLSFGWMLMQGLGILLKFKPLAFSWTVWVRRGLLALLAGIALLFLPLVIEAACCWFIFEASNSYNLQLSPWYSYFFMCWTYLCTYVEFLFPLLGGALWLFGLPGEKPVIEPKQEANDTEKE